MPEYRVYDRELKRKYTISANSTDEIDPGVYDVLDEEASDQHGPLAVEYDVTKSGKASAAPITDGSAVTKKEN